MQNLILQPFYDIAVDSIKTLESHGSYLAPDSWVMEYVKFRQACLDSGLAHAWMFARHRVVEYQKQLTRLVLGCYSDFCFKCQ